ncbi:MAG: HAMP domain-containing sensor histidine kinase [bacterium]
MKLTDSHMEGTDHQSGGFFRELRIEFLIHELKDPLAVIETGLRMLLEKQESYGGLSRKQERTLQRSLRAARKARAMLHGLLEVGRSEAGCFSCERFPVSRTIQGVILEAVESMDAAAQEELSEGEISPKVLAKCGVKLDVDPALEETFMCQDQAKFCQIVGNLVKNALHHRQSKVEVRVSRQDQLLEVEVADDGPGIHPEHQDLIFKRYAQLEAPQGLARRGHGLGLAGAKILAQALGGSLEVKSQKGKGAVFRLLVPLNMEELEIKGSREG